MLLGQQKVWGTVVGRTGAVTGTPPVQKGDPLVVRYTIEADDPSLGLVLPNWLPERRISRGAKVIVAQVGDPVVIQLSPGRTVVWMVTEGIPFLEACPR